MKNEDLNRLNTEPLPVEGHGVVSFELLGVLKKSLATWDHEAKLLVVYDEGNDVPRHGLS